MSTTVTAAESPDSRPPAQRGSLHIPERVVQRIAAQAASEVAAGGRSGGVLGIGSHADPDARPEVRVRLTPDFADLDIKITVPYPTSIRAVAQRVRTHVADRVEHLAGVAVHRVDIDVVAVGADAADPGPNGGLR